MLVKKKDTEDYYALKIMSIRCIINTKQVDHVYSEKRILAKLTHPFIVTLYVLKRSDRRRDGSENSKELVFSLNFWRRIR